MPEKKIMSPSSFAGSHVSYKVAEPCSVPRQASIIFQLHGNEHTVCIFGNTLTSECTSEPRPNDGKIHQPGPIEPVGASVLGSGMI